MTNPEAGTPTSNGLFFCCKTDEVARLEPKDVPPVFEAPYPEDDFRSEDPCKIEDFKLLEVKDDDP